MATPGFDHTRAVSKGLVPWPRHAKGESPSNGRRAPINRPRFDPRNQPRTFSGPRTNHRIRVPEVRVIGANQEMLGVLPTHEALRLAREAAGGLDVRIGGGPTVVRDFLAAGLVDHLHVVISPIVLGRGVRLWDGLEGLESGYAIEAVTTPSGVTHVTFDRA